ncbi:MAG: hypothetical protein SOX84_00515 [Prevotella sp.]|nr:hypothetical protein [Prevotella sp.]
MKSMFKRLMTFTIFLFFAQSILAQVVFDPQSDKGKQIGSKGDTCFIEKEGVRIHVTDGNLTNGSNYRFFKESDITITSKRAFTKIIVQSDQEIKSYSRLFNKQRIPVFFPSDKNNDFIGQWRGRCDTLKLRAAEKKIYLKKIILYFEEQPTLKPASFTIQSFVCQPHTQPTNIKLNTAKVLSIKKGKSTASMMLFENKTVLRIKSDKPNTFDTYKVNQTLTGTIKGAQWLPAEVVPSVQYTGLNVTVEQTSDTPTPTTISSAKDYDENHYNLVRIMLSGNEQAETDIQLSNVYTSTIPIHLINNTIKAEVTGICIPQTENENILRTIAPLRTKDITIVYDELHPNNPIDSSQAEGFSAKVERSTPWHSHIWSTITLPFSLHAEEVKSIFGEGVKLASFSSSNTEKIAFSTLTEPAIQAGMPYLIKAEKEVFFIHTNAAMFCQNPTPQIIQGETYDFVSTLKDEYPNDDCFYLAGTKLKKLKTGGRIKPFRAFFVQKSPDSPAKEITIDGVATKIDLPNSTTTDSQCNNFFTIGGIKLSPNQPLRKGQFYIQKGKVTLFYN